jgi:uncharacterized membrane protein YebE (DUF533 family)
MILWGTRGLKSTLEKGEFHCPRCGPDKSFKLVAINRWFTLYFIPILPMGQAGQYLECQACSGTFDEQARNYDPQAEASKFRDELGGVLLRSMLAVAGADGHVEHRELEVMANVLTRITGTAYEIEDIHGAIDNIAPEPLDKVLKEISSNLNDEGKVMVVHALAMVARADGDVAEEELGRVFKAGKTLGLRRAHIQQILALDEE